MAILLDSCSIPRLIGRSHGIALPYMSSPVRGGFPSPADDHIEKRIDLNQALVLHPEATFIVRVAGRSMIGVGIDDGDELVVDRALEPRHGDVVIAVLDNEFTVKRLHKRRGVVRLEAANPDFPPIQFAGDKPCEIWGVVTNVIKALRKR